MKKTNKGFSMVELIIVIAIMAILAGALAPTLIKYINKSRLSTDIQTGQTIATAIQAALGVEEAYDDASDASCAAITGLSGTKFSKEVQVGLGNKVPTLKSKKDIKGTALGSTAFYVTVDAANSKIEVYAGKTDSDHMVYPNVGASMAE